MCDRQSPVLFPMCRIVCAVGALVQLGDAVLPQACFFRAFIRWTTGAAAWDHLNRTMSIAVAEREARSVVLRVYGLS